MFLQDRHTMNATAAETSALGSSSQAAPSEPVAGSASERQQWLNALPPVPQFMSQCRLRRWFCGRRVKCSRPGEAGSSVAVWVALHEPDSEESDTANAAPGANRCLACGCSRDVRNAASKSSKQRIGEERRGVRGEGRHRRERHAPSLNLRQES